MMRKRPLVNAHTHLELGWAAPFRPKSPRPFHLWLRRQMHRNASAMKVDDFEARQSRGIYEGIRQLIEAGVTHVGDVTVSGLSVRPLLESGLGGVVYIELLGLEDGVDTFMFKRAVEILEQYRPQEQNGLRIGLSAHATYSVTPQALEMVADYCLREEVPFCMHLGESTDAREALHGEGSLYHMPIQQGGRNHPPAPQTSAVVYLRECGILETRPLFIHAIDLTDGELDILADHQVKVVHCPRSNTLLKNGRMPLEKLLARNIPVALGTESLTAAPSLDVREEAAVAKKLHVGVVEPELIEGLLENVKVFE